MTIGFALCGSFCTYAQVFPAMEAVKDKFENVIPIFSTASGSLDSRFGAASEHLRRAEAICGRPPIRTIPEAEPIGPKKLLDALVIAPCTGNTLAKLAHGIADGPVTMATNDGLGAAAENIGRLLVRRHIYFVPFGQDDPRNKPASLVADFTKIVPTLESALAGVQLQPLLSLRA